MFDGFEARRIDTDGAAIFLEFGETGPPLLLLHGFPQTHPMWHETLACLAERYTLICPDLRCYGASSNPPDGKNREGYRAAAGIDLEHDRADAAARIACPLLLLWVLVLWGVGSVAGKLFDPLAVWREKAGVVTGEALDGGHFLPGERLQQVLAALKEFLD